MPRALEGCHLLVAVDGGFAACEAFEFVRELKRHGAAPEVALSPSAAEFIRPRAFEEITGRPVPPDPPGPPDTSVAEARLLLLLAPDLDRLLHPEPQGSLRVARSGRLPVLVVPASHEFTGADLPSQVSLPFLPPTALTGTREAGRALPPVERLIAEVERCLTPADLAGQTVLVTAGPNREPIDPVRFVGNRSSGKMGYALAAAAWRRGGRVVLVSGPTGLPTPWGVHRRDVTTAAQMHAAVLEELPAATILVMAAAVADYRPREVAPQKLKKSPGGQVIELVRTVDILLDVARLKGDRLHVGFAAETENLEQAAAAKLRDKALDLIVANDVTRAAAGFETDTNEVLLLDRTGAREELPLLSKDEVADRILDRIVSLRG